MKLQKPKVAPSLFCVNFSYGQPLLSSLPFENNEITVEKVTASLVGLAIYFIPTIIARDKKKWKLIALFNLLTGWTIFGWFIALLWAIKAESKVKIDFTAEMENEDDDEI
ncbi:superinfection immunity protein [Flavobacterium sp.]|uniref:superinfection immunity protein n=1 Tax=Flavobacterium sp. TaxID=239 RepID=UPI002627421D|nr:superinfection immunity protein [Flavobacterium sp.]